ncbi:MAG: hypothetical protein WB853_17500 [Desulfobacterales bacterium]
MLDLVSFRPFDMGEDDPGVVDQTSFILVLHPGAGRHGIRMGAVLFRQNAEGRPFAGSRGVGVRFVELVLESADGKGAHHVGNHTDAAVLVGRNVPLEPGKYSFLLPP